ncbi:polysaccharide pyruvyl transferase family protein [Paraeggerthella hongkongensis]|uniref:Polysaccharide pyruvyl transferase domain-containing protein n=1 Tax=Paraeggerthella hongkongensis TaxID=230658 RepID=A0A3N0BDV8_9ACTN|nr:polysaccharide pyruvyl transferase family protein [Paraeggerthella hongkongensis]RNL45765.1 hypothetical protein DMP08_05455 [Paraeggerthella hongkongensis]
MKKVGIVTLHRSYSYGACLQAYATKLAIEQMGCNASFVNYVNENEQYQKRFVSRRRDHSFNQNAVASLKNIMLGRIPNERKAFDQFHEEFLPSLDETSNMASISYSNFDILLSGSDQLWNPELFGGLDRAYFLQFGNCRKIAYAASAGSYRYSKGELATLENYLATYNQISVREANLKSQISKIVDTPVEEVLDPTFLITGEEWLDLAKKHGSFSHGKPYVLVYLVGVSKAHYEIAYAKVIEEVKRRYGCEALLIRSDGISFSGCDKKLKRITPWDLILAISNAELNIASSFHGVAFAVNLGANFIALDNPSNPLRVQNLLADTGLEWKRYADTGSVSSCLDKPSYAEVGRRVDEARAKSLGWLSQALDCQSF